MYHPLTSAAMAAWTELSCPEAIQFYSDRLFADSMATYATVRHLCLMVIQMGQFCHAWCDDLVETSLQPERMPVLNAVKIAGSLPAISSYDHPVLVTPAPVPSSHSAVSRLGIRDLRRLCSECGIPRASRLSKAEAISALSRESNKS